MSERRWLEGLLDPAAMAQLTSGLAGSELQSVLLSVLQQRARARSPSAVLTQYDRDAFCAPASVDLRISNAIDAHFLAAAPEFEAIELSPVAPLGACSTVALTDQNRVLSALRGTEVVSDPTNVMALECALRLRKAPDARIHLATSQRVLRAQPIPKRPGHTQHFRLFALASAGVEAKAHGFTLQALELHIRTMGQAFDRLERHGYTFGQRRVVVLATPERQALGERLVTALGASAQLKLLEHAYYSGGLRYQLWVTAPDGNEIPLVDGGTFTWLHELSSNRRAVFVASGTGAQLIALRFASPPSPA